VPPSLNGHDVVEIQFFVDEIAQDVETMHEAGLDVDAVGDGVMAAAAASTLCQNFGYGGVADLLWPHDLHEFGPDHPCRRTALIRSITFALCELQRLDSSTETHADRTD